MQTKLPIITHQECNQYFSGHGPNENHNICTFDGSRRRAACSGDEGGPLVYDKRLLGILIVRSLNTWKTPDIFVNFNSFNLHDSVNFHMNVARRVH